MCAKKQHSELQLIRNRYYTEEDYINQIYLDLPLYQYNSSRYLWFCMRLSCLNISYGGYGYKKGNNLDYLLISLDKPIKDGSDRPLGDAIASKKDYFERIPDEQLEEFDKFC